MARTVFITANGTFTVPSDFSSLVSIDCIGPGGSGACGNTADGNLGSGAGGGAFSRITSLSLTAGQVCQVQVGLGGAAIVSNAGSPRSGNDGSGTTWFSTTAVAPTNTTEGVLADYGRKGVLNMGLAATGGAGGANTSCIGSVKYSGGKGGDTNNITGGCGGGAAGGSKGKGGDGGNAIDNTAGGAGGGGADSGATGATGQSGGSSGGQGGSSGTDGTAGGAGGVGSSTYAQGGSHGSGGGGGSNQVPYAHANTGGPGIGYTQTSNAAVAGPGGGGGAGGGPGGNGGAGGNYGGGGGSTGANGITVGAGGNGIIIFTYNTSPRDWAAAEGLAEQTTTSSTVWTTQVKLTFTPKTGSAYAVFWSASACPPSSLADDIQIELLRNAAAVGTWNIEAKEATTPPDYPGVGGFYYHAADSGAGAYELHFKSETAGQTAKLKDARLVAIELIANDVYAESLAHSTTTSSGRNGGVVKLTGNITAPGGGADYLIIGSWTLDCSSAATTDCAMSQLRVDDVPYVYRSGDIGYPVSRLITKDVTNYVPYFEAYKVTLASGAHTAKINYGNNGNGETAGITGARVLALALGDGFGENLYDITVAEPTTASATYGGIGGAISTTFQGGNYFVLGWDVRRPNSTTIAGFSRFNFDGAFLNEQNAEQSSADDGGYLGIFTGVVTLSAASHSLAIEQKNNSGTSTLYGGGAIIAIKLPSRSPRDYKYAEGLAEQTTTSGTVWTTQATLTFTPKATSDYLLMWSGSLSLGNTTSDGQADLFDVTSNNELILQNIVPESIGPPTDYVGVGGLYQHKAPMLLLHMEGTDEAQVFTDSSKYARTITAKGNAKTDSAQSKFGSTAAYFDGTGDCLTVPDSANLELGANDFTIQFWFRASVATGGSWKTLLRKNSSSDGVGIDVEVLDGTLGYHISVDGSTNKFSHEGFSSVSADTWYHIALVRFGTTFRLFHDGVGQYTDAFDTATQAIADTTGPWAIGAQSYDGTNIKDGFTGWIDEFSIEIGHARWTADFTPPTQPYGSESRSFAARFKSETTTVTTKMKDTRLIALEMTADDIYAEVLSDTSAMGEVTKVTANITVPTGGGSYLVIGSTNIHMAGGIGYVFLREGASGPGHYMRSASGTAELLQCNDDTNHVPLTSFYKADWAAGAHDVRWITGDYGVNVGILDARLALIRLDDNRFGERFYAELAQDDETTGGSASYTDTATLTQTFAGGDYLLVGGGIMTTQNDNTGEYGRVILDGTTNLIEQNQWTINGTCSKSAAFTAAKATLSAASHTLAFQKKNYSGTAGSLSVGAVLAVQIPSLPSSIPGTLYIGFAF